jgi:cobalt-zinc-cadmium efflux system protein
MSSGHGHGEARGHAHAHHARPGSGDHRRPLALVLAITLVTAAAQVIGTLLSGSLALLADAGHLLTDAMGLVLALATAVLTTRATSTRRTWGFVRAEALSAALQAVLLTGVACFVIVEGVRRLLVPPPVAADVMFGFGLLGLLGNAVAVVILLRSRSANLNLRAAFLEVVNDALGSVAVLVAAVVIATTRWVQADAVVSLLVGALILPRAVLILRDAASVLLESTPRGLDLAEVRRHLLENADVHEVHDLHASSVATGLPVLTAHVVVADDCFRDGRLPQLLDAVQHCVADHFPVSIEHSTFQFEPVSHVDHERATHA